MQTSKKIKIIAHTNSKKPRIDNDLFGDLHIYVSEPPLEGKANNAIVQALAKHFKVSRSSVQLVSGQKSKHKLFNIYEN